MPNKYEVKAALGFFCAALMLVGLAIKAWPVVRKFHERREVSWACFQDVVTSREYRPYQYAFISCFGLAAAIGFANAAW